MVESGGDVGAEIVAEIASEIHAFVQAFPNHYAARALVTLVNRQASGERIASDERDLVVLTLAREAKKRAGARRFAPSPARSPNAVDERV